MDVREALMKMLNELRVGQTGFPVNQFNRVIDDIGEMFEKGTLLELAKGFNALKTDSAKVQFVANLPFMKSLSFGSPFFEKSHSLALGCRERGNAFYLQQKYDDALSQYNVAILLSPYPSTSDEMGSDSMSLSFSNRSALLFKNNRFADALLDIERAFKYGLPEHLHVKVWKRKGECYSAIGKYADAIKCFIKAKIISKDKAIERGIQDLMAIAKQENVMNNKKNSPYADLSKAARKLSKPLPSVYGGINPMVPSASNYLAVVANSEGRKRVVATRDIPLGEPILIEEAFAYSLAAQNYYQNCYLCLKRTDVPVSCSQCATIFYCGEECRDLSWELNHKVDCKIIHLIFTNQWRNIQLQNTLLTCLKVFINTGQPRLKELFEMETEKNRKGKAKKQHVNGVYDSKSHLPILEMQTVEGEYWSLEEFKATVYSVILLVILDSINFFADAQSANVEAKHPVLSELSNFQLFVGTRILKHLSSLPFRGRYITESHSLSSPLAPAVPSELTFQRIGYGAYAVFGLLKHSCDANTFPVFHGSTAVVYSLASISKGDELTESNLNCDYRRMNLDKRQEIHQKWVRFDCTCAVCANDWPLEDMLPSLFKDTATFKCAKMTTQIFASQVINADHIEVYKGTFFITKTIFENRLSKKDVLNIIELLRIFEKHLPKPNYEINKIEIALKVCLSSQGYLYRNEKPPIAEITDHGQTARVLTNILCGSIVAKTSQ